MNILFLTHRLPYAPNRGDRIRALYLMREMATLGRVTLISLVHDDEEEAAMPRVPHASRVIGLRVRRLRNLAAGALRLPTRRPLDALAARRARRAPDHRRRHPRDAP